MTVPVFTLSLIRELRGSPLTILVAIIMLEQSGQVPFTAQLLKDVTGYKDHTITDSLRVLELPACQIVSRVTGGWRLASGFQLPLVLDPQNREYRDNLPVNDVVAVIEEPREKKGTNSINKSKNREYRDSYRSALAVGIMDPKATEISKLAWVSPDYIRSLSKAVHKEKWDNPIGMLIHRIQNHYPGPDDRSVDQIVNKWKAR